MATMPAGVDWYVPVPIENCSVNLEGSIRQTLRPSPGYYRSQKKNIHRFVSPMHSLPIQAYKPNAGTRMPEGVTLSHAFTLVKLYSSCVLTAMLESRMLFSLLLLGGPAGVLAQGTTTSVAPPPWQTGIVTEDGTCGSDTPEKWVCSPIWGACCSKDGLCGRSTAFCGEGWYASPLFSPSLFLCHRFVN